MVKKMIISALVVFSCSAPALAAGQPGTSDTVFNRRFAHKLKPAIPYEQLVRMVGVEGMKVREDRRASPSRTAYHWNGKRRSALDVTVAAGRVVEATVTGPKKQRFSLGKRGEVMEQ